MRLSPDAFALGEGPTRWGLSDICFHAADGLLFSFRKVFVGAPEAFLEGDLRLPVKVAFGFGVVQGGAVDITLSGFIIGGGDLFAGDFGEDGDQFFQAGLPGSTEVVDGIGRFGRERLKDAVCDITGVDEVAGLISIAQNGDALPFGDAFRKDADDAAFPAVALAFAVDIGKAEDDIVYAIGEAVELEIILGCLFGETVKGKRLLRQGFGNRERAIGHIPIGRRGGGEDNTLDAVFPAALEDADCAGDVLMHVVLGISHGVGDEGLRRKMHDGIEVFLFENVFDRLVMDIHDDELHMREQVLAKAGGEIVQCDGFVACCFECPHQVGTDESGSAGNKYFHVLFYSFVCMISGSGDVPDTVRHRLSCRCRESILHLCQCPSLRAYSLETIQHCHFYALPKRLVTLLIRVSAFRLWVLLRFSWCFSLFSS